MKPLVVCPACSTEHGAAFCPKCGAPDTVSQNVLFRDARIAVLLFDHALVAGRDGRRSFAFDSMRNTGIRKICKDLRQPYEFCTPATMDRYDAVFVSLHSFLDIANVMLYVPTTRRTAVIVGGPACHNIRPMIGRVDVANFGRCDSGKINRILDGENLPSVWRATADPTFSGGYTVDHATPEGMDPSENMVGCHKRCAFCFYSWWNGPTATRSRYSSGFGGHEDFFSTMDWETAKRGAVTAIDGQTAEIRRHVGKPLSVKGIASILARANDVVFDKALRVKLYTIVGYPGETADAAVVTDMVDACRIADEQSKNRIVIAMKPSHFIPFQKTPMWAEPFNLADMRPAAIAAPVLFSGKHITLYSGGSYTPTPMRAALSTVFQRAGVADIARVQECVRRFSRGGRASDKTAFIAATCGDLLDAQRTEIMDNITTGTERFRTPNSSIVPDFSGSDRPRKKD